MAFSTSYIIAPLVGSIIGCITNDLIIRMLFRLHTAKYIFGMHVPFTPGIIPMEKGRIAKVTYKVEELYRTVITEHLPRILKTLDISKIVTERINEMDVAKTEKHILQVMKKELRAIVWLGAGLALLMGYVNVIL